MTLRPLGRERVRLRRTSLIVIACVAVPTALADAYQASDTEFQAGFFRQEPGQPNQHAKHALRALTVREELPPGRYLIHIQVNLAPTGLHELLLQIDPVSGRTRPCLTPELLDELGLRLDALPDPSVLDQSCLDLPGLVPGALADFDSSQLQLAISIPQIALRRGIADQVDPARWDNGIPAAFVNYQASVMRSSSSDREDYSNQDLYLNGGINLGGWRLRSSQSWRKETQGSNQWSRAYTYAQHDLPGTWGNITLGQSFTSSEVFRGIPVSGLRLASDFDMLPDSHRSYAPTIRGVAQTRAKLEVWQNGYPIYSTYVSPGPYAIDDLNVGGSGELEVVLTEADGQIRRFIQPYASISNLLRPGVWRYSTTLGRYNPASGGQTPSLWQGTIAAGTAWNATLYGGLMVSEGYAAQAVGVARDLGAAGALSFDITQSRSDISPVEDQILHGFSYAIKYSKAFNSGTHLRFAGYRYSTQGYRDFDEWITQRSSDRTFLGSRRSRLESSINQRLGQRSSLSISLSQQDYWQRSDVQRQFQFNFSTQHNGISYSLNGSQSLTQTRSGSDRQFGLSVSIPMEFGRSSTLSLDVQRSDQGMSQRAALISNTEHLSYNASVATNERQQQSAGLSVAYQAPQATVGAGLTTSAKQHNLSFNVSGAALVHGGGLELGPYLGETIGLVHVPDIADVGVQNNSALRTNAKGYALVPHLRPYRANQLVLDTDRLGPEVDIENATATVVPRRGSVIKSQFSARRINRLVLTLMTGDRQPLPFGTRLHDANDEVVGMVGQAGQAMLSLGQGVQSLEARWGDAQVDRCLFQVNPESIPPDQGYRLQTLACK